MDRTGITLDIKRMLCTTTTEYNSSDWLAV